MLTYICDRRNTLLEAALKALHYRILCGTNQYINQQNIWSMKFLCDFFCMCGTEILQEIVHTKYEP